jgi:hypothetical protein
MKAVVLLVVKAGLSEHMRPTCDGVAIAEAGTPLCGKRFSQVMLIDEPDDLGGAEKILFDGWMDQCVQPRMQPDAVIMRGVAE